MLRITIEPNAIRIGERCAVAFQRTLRIPDDGRVYPLPPGFGPLPVFMPPGGEGVMNVRPKCDAIIPMHQREALWLSFAAARWKPNAVKVAVGEVNAISGESEQGGLGSDPQNYIVCPMQPWLDGINSGQGSVRQFVAMPLGQGYTVEASIRGSESTGGIQLTVFEPKPGRFPDQAPSEPAGPMQNMAAAQAMGLGAGGTIRQKIYPDPYGIETWDMENFGTVRVEILNSVQFRELTGLPVPPTAIDTAAYIRAGLPWFDLYDDEAGDVRASERLARVKTIAERDKETQTGDAEAEGPEVCDSKVRRLRKD